MEKVRRPRTDMVIALPTQAALLQLSTTSGSLLVVYKSHLGDLADLFSPQTVLRIVNFYTAVGQFEELLNEVDKINLRVDIPPADRGRLIKEKKELLEEIRSKIPAVADQAIQGLTTEGATIPVDDETGK